MMFVVYVFASIGLAVTSLFCGIVISAWCEAIKLKRAARRRNDRLRSFSKAAPWN